MAGCAKEMRHVCHKLDKIATGHHEKGHGVQHPHFKDLRERWEEVLKGVLGLLEGLKGKVVEAEVKVKVEVKVDVKEEKTEKKNNDKGTETKGKGKAEKGTEKGTKKEAHVEKVEVKEVEAKLAEVKIAEVAESKDEVEVK